MSKEDAISKAFKFGNPTSRDSHSLGMYGIGMKRSIFKIGENFVVNSKTSSDSFKVYMNLEEWMELKDPNTKEEIWKFHIEDQNNDFENGVQIRIEKLSHSIKNYLKWANNIKALKDKIGSSYREQLSKNITIKLNGVPIITTQDELLISPILEVYINNFEYKNVNVKIIAGVGNPIPKKAGWNIICNGRHIIEYDKSELTGWEANYDVEDEDEFDDLLLKKKIPTYHNDFARFRGFVIMNSEDPQNLPLNTTKDGIDQQHSIYREIYKEMLEIMSMILPKLRELQKVIRVCKIESKVSPEQAFEAIKVTELILKKENRFKLNLSEYDAPAEVKKIPVQIEKSVLDSMKKYFEVTTNKELGERILQYVLDRVILDE